MTIIQFHNKALWVMIFAWLVSHFSTGYVSAISRVVFLTAGIIWAYEEIKSGVNWFRRMLGLVVLLVLFMGLVMELKLQ